MRERAANSAATGSIMVVHKLANASSVSARRNPSLAASRSLSAIRSDDRPRASDILAARDIIRTLVLPLRTLSTSSVKLS